MPFNERLQLNIPQEPRAIGCTQQTMPLRMILKIAESLRVSLGTSW